LTSLLFYAEYPIRSAPDVLACTLSIPHAADSSPLQLRIHQKYGKRALNTKYIKSANLIPHLEGSCFVTIKYELTEMACGLAEKAFFDTSFQI
jgi:hypothetical protein